MTIALDDLAASLKLDIDAFVAAARQASSGLESLGDDARAAGRAADDIEAATRGAGRAAGDLGDDMRGLGDDIDSAFSGGTGDVDDMAAGLEDVGRAADDAAAGVAGMGDSAGGIEDIGGAAEGASGDIGGMGDAADQSMGMMVAAFAGGAAVEAASKLGEKVTEAFSLALDFDDANAKTAAQLGLSADAAGTYGKMAGDLFSNNYGESIGQVNEALVLMNRNVGDAVGDQESSFEDATASVLDLASAMDQDLAPITKAIGQMIKTGLAVDARDALNVLTRGFQEGADASEDLLDTFNEYSTNFRDLGLNAQQAMGLLLQGLHAGARDTDQVADGLAEFTKLTKENGDQQVESFGRIGLSAADMAHKVSQGGPEAAHALQQVFEGIAKIPDPALRAKTAIELFGTPVEDMAGAFGNLNLDTAAQQLGDVSGAAEKMGNTLADTASSRIETFRRQLESGLVSFMGEKVIPAVERGLDAVKPFYDAIKNLGELVVSGFTGEGVTAVSDILPPELVTVAVQIGEKVRDLYDVVFPKLKEAWDKIFEAGERFMAWARQNEDVMNGLKALLGVGLVVGIYLAVTAFIALAAAAWSAAAGVLAATWPAVAIAAAVVALAAAVSWAYRNWGWFKTAVDAVATAAVWLWEHALVPLGGFIAGTLIPALVTVAGAIGNFLVNLVGWMGNIPEALGAIVEFFENLPGKAIEFLGMLWTTISTWVVTTATSLPGLFVGWVTSFTSWLVELVVGLPEKLAYIAGYIIGWILGQAVVFGENLRSWAGAVWNWIMTTKDELPGRLYDIAVAIGLWIMDFAAELPGRLSAWWDEFRNLVSRLAVDLGLWLMNAAASIWNWIQTTRDELPGRLGAWAAAVRDWAYQLAVDVGLWLIDVGRRIYDWILGIPDQVRGALSTAANIGKSVVEGIWNGISGAGGWLMDKIRSFAKGVIDGFMNAIRGGSPAMELVPVGQSVVQGIDLGMVREAPRLAATAATIMGDMTASMLGTTSGGGLQAAAQELLGLINSGATWFEDMSAMGQSDNLRHYNEQLADMFWSENAGRDFGSGGWEANAARDMLTRTISAGNAPEVTFKGNTSDALATAIMQMVRSGQIQIAA